MNSVSSIKQRPLWRLAVATLPEAEEAVAELLASHFGQPASSYTDRETGLTTVTAYFQEKPDWSPAKRASFAAALKQLKAYGLHPGSGKISLAKMRQEDWAESWKRHFKPIELGSSLLLKPSWSRRRPRPGQALVVIDPGLSFGTGQHPTTGFCLQQLVKQRNPKTPQSFLDIGTGSGILAIAAATLGYAPVDAFDFDPDAVRIARANARKNRVSRKLHLSKQDVTRLPIRSAAKYSVVCANLIANLLLSERKRILARLRPDGVLVVAGILKTEFPKVQSAYETAGLRLAASRTENEWRSGAFVWNRRS